MIDWQPKLTAGEWRALVGNATYVLELGCHEGQDTVTLLEAFPKAQIHCWEPDYRPGTRFLRRFGSCLRVHFSAEAICDNDGWTPWHASHGRMPSDDETEVSLELRRDWDASGSIMQPTGHQGFPPWLGFQVNGIIPTARLDTWLEKHHDVACVDLIWADIQGAEARMIRGAQETLKRTRYLYLEVYDLTLMPEHKAPAQLYDGQPTYQELCDLLPGWEVVGGYNCDAVLWRNRDFH